MQCDTPDHFESDFMDIPFAVFFDGGCPVCRKEIAYYQRRSGGEKIQWIDITAIEGDEVAAGLDKAAAMKRFHVRRRSGEMVSGARAFTALWGELKSTRLLGKILALPVIVDVLEAGYLGFLKIRPLWRPHQCDDESCNI